MVPTRAVFLDRDGTIAPDVNYCRRVDDFRLFPGAASAVRTLNEAGLLVVIVTNQSGVGRGYFNLDTLAAIHEHMRAQLASGGARVDAVYYCPHLPGAGCACRKPQPGMLHQARQDLNVDLGASFMVGDKESDIAAGSVAGCRSVLIDPARGSTSTIGSVATPAYHAPGLTEATRWILAQAVPVASRRAAY